MSDWCWNLIAMLMRIIILSSYFYCVYCVHVISSEQTDNAFTLSGTRESIAHAKDSLNSLCAQHNASGGVETISAIVVPPTGNAGYPPYQEIMVPGAKVGLVIGKGGETIKMLQEKTGAKMVIIQDGPGQELEKPLRISGDPQKVEHAKQLVFDLILDKEGANNTNNRYSFNGGGGGGSVPSGGDQAEVFVPKTAVGVVIGKGGEMIKKIQADTGCKLQFIQGKGDGPGDRRCIISGTTQQVEDGKRTIEDLIDSVMRSNQNNPNRNNQNQGMTNSNYGYGTDNSQQASREEVSFSVPASKCGIVIGRGGETIKLINQQSGAFCEMDRSAINPPSEKMFKMKGSSEQIEHARQLISDKIGIEITILSTRQIGAGGPGGQGPQGYPGMQGANGSNPFGQSQQQQWTYQQQMWDPSQQQSAGAAGQPDYSAQWIEYYKWVTKQFTKTFIQQFVIWKLKWIIHFF